ncbi:hypothetical protein CYMTET_48243 [Cymbomonas tetramitiformis]|uniref:Peptidase M20 dimerisation domain-containing protein n=1 Tax=Cymbomonas tetramitiformis TaxID=36881 RepID=A0AAE0EWX8_9CHLO|nr:hypothetical protein CYMTET_48243 [Cymbomonas tetramitiformis]
MKGLDLSKLKATAGYTLDAELLGDIQMETFSADKATVEINGIAIHPCCAKGVMVNALRLAAHFVAELPEEGMSPESTEGKEGFIHPYAVEGTAAAARVALILRDFELEGLEEKRQIVRSLCASLQEREPRASVTCSFHEQYRNMRYWLDQNMEPVQVAEKAMEDLKIVSRRGSIRGGTDGSQLTARGLPTPNLFAGWHNAHGPLEWASLGEMQLSLEVVKQIISYHSNAEGK